MNLTSDELAIVEYLKALGAESVTLPEICRHAGGQRKFEASPYWAGPLMLRLVEMQLVATDGGGRYRIANSNPAAAETTAQTAVQPASDPVASPKSESVVDDNYFPSPAPVSKGNPPSAPASPGYSFPEQEDDNYFPAADRSKAEKRRSVSPKVTKTVKASRSTAGKKSGAKHRRS